jgi:hypothetical protein
LHSRLIDPKSPVIESSTGPSSSVFSKYKSELAQRRKLTVVEKHKQAASKIVMDSAFRERAADVSNPYQFMKNDEVEQSSKLLTDLRKPPRSVSPGSKAHPAIRGAMSGPVAGSQTYAQTERRLLRLAIMAKAEELWKTGRTKQYSRANPPTEQRQEESEHLRTKISSVIQSQSKDFVSRYAVPPGTSANEQVHFIIPDIILLLVIVSICACRGLD